MQVGHHAEILQARVSGAGVRCFPPDSAAIQSPPNFLSLKENDNNIHDVSIADINLQNTQLEYRPISEKDIIQFAAKLRNEGQRIPVIVRGKTAPYQLICGYRRVRSLAIAGITTVKAIIIPEISDEEAHRLSIIENEEKKSLTDLDRANCCKKLICHEKINETKSTRKLGNTFNDG